MISFLKRIFTKDTIVKKAPTEEDKVEYCCTTCNKSLSRDRYLKSICPSCGYVGPFGVSKRYRGWVRVVERRT